MAALSKKENAAEIAEHTFVEFQRLALSFIPAGAVLDSFLGFHARLKQKRIIDFSESLKNVLQDCAGRTLCAQDFQTEEFVDVMEFVYQKVQNTKSQRKLEHFRNLLFRQIVEPLSLEMTLVYSRILDDINELELVFLQELNRCTHEELTTDNFFDTIFGAQGNSSEPRAIALGDQHLLIHDYTLHYHLDRLVSLGLLSKHSEGFSNPFDSDENKDNMKKKTYLGINGIGEDFLQFIRNPD